MKKLSVLIVFLFCFCRVFPQDEGSVRILRGRVIDQNAAPVDRAEVSAISESGRIHRCQNKDDGEFACELKFTGDVLLTVQAEGFSILRQTVDKTQDFGSPLTLTLSPAPLAEEVVVTANRTATRLGETPASIVSLSGEEIRRAAAPTIDDALRQVPGFSLFRRSGSRTANPTTQGVSLRGVGASGAGRSLVLLDEVPLNDPFGGWVQWSRVAPIALERAEVLRGGASSLYGDDSLSGTINLLGRRARRKYDFSAEVFGGTQKTFSASTFFGLKNEDWSADLAAAEFQTRGFIPIDKRERGRADTFAGARNLNLSARVEKNLSDRGNLFFKTSYFGEARDNGTALQKNRTHIRQFAVGGEFLPEDPRSEIRDLKLNWIFYGGTQVFDQIFSAVADDRTSENLVRLQRVPAQNFGFSGRFSAVVGDRQTLVFGVEAEEVRGASDETGFFGGRATSRSGAGGRQRTIGIFAQDLIRVGSRIVVAGSLRYDFRKNFRALNSVRTLSTGAVNTTIFPDRTEGALSPQASIIFQATDRLSFHAVASKSFRAPTLNELYRGFRVGDVITNPNETLRAEKAFNFEAGASFGLRDLYLRGNFFYTEISDPIANVTLSAMPSLITRQRQNIGKTRATGLEFEAEKHWRGFDFSAGYLLSDSRVRRFEANPLLEGLMVPLVSRHQFTFQTSYSNKNGWSFSFQGRAASKQFDDDLNLFRLEPFFQLDAFAAKRFRRRFQIFIAVENLFNSRYSVGRTPVRSVSSPVGGRIGVRWN
ncbi:MAG: TonB-dependent receptor [Pyrinomonadaceae bacterium]